MTTVDSSITWAVLAPLSVRDLEDLAEREWRREFPEAIDPPPWTTVPGHDDYNALVSRSPGAEGGDRRFAEILSAQAGKPVYSLWLDPERQAIFVWDNGRSSERDGDPLGLAESLGFAVSEPRPRSAESVAVVEGASLDDVRGVAEAWINLAGGRAGVIVTADDGSLGTQPWDIAEALPSATVYFVQQWLDQFTVLVLRGKEELDHFRFPPFDGDTSMSDNIKGETTPGAIRAALGIEDA